MLPDLAPRCVSPSLRSAPVQDDGFADVSASLVLSPISHPASRHDQSYLPERLSLGRPPAPYPCDAPTMPEPKPRESIHLPVTAEQRVARRLVSETLLQEACDAKLLEMIAHVCRMEALASIHLHNVDGDEPRCMSNQMREGFWLQEAGRRWSGLLGKFPLASIPLAPVVAAVAAALHEASAYASAVLKESRVTQPRAVAPSNYLPPTLPQQQQRSTPTLPNDQCQSMIAEFVSLIFPMMSNITLLATSYMTKIPGQSVTTVGDVAKQLAKDKQIKIFCSQAVKSNGPESVRNLVARINNNLDNILEAAVEARRLVNERSTRHPDPAPASAKTLAHPAVSELPKPDRATTPPPYQNSQKQKEVKKEHGSAPPLCENDRVSSTPTQQTVHASRCPAPQKAKKMKKKASTMKEEEAKKEVAKEETKRKTQVRKPPKKKLVARGRAVSRTDKKTLPTSRHPAASDAQRRKGKKSGKARGGEEEEKKPSEEKEVVRREVGKKFRPADRVELNERARGEEESENAKDVEGLAVVQSCAVAPSRPGRPLRGRPCDSYPPTSLCDVLPGPAPAATADPVPPLFSLCSSSQNKQSKQSKQNNVEERSAKE